LKLPSDKHSERLNVANITSRAYSYLGDAVFELCVREYLVLECGISDVQELNDRAKEYVSASSQAELMPLISPLLTEDEDKVFRHARNKGHTPVSKNINAKQYRVATGLEALFGYLYAEQRFDRIKELFAVITKERSER